MDDDWSGHDLAVSRGNRDKIITGPLLKWAVCTRLQWVLASSGSYAVHLSTSSVFSVDAVKKSVQFF